MAKGNKFIALTVYLEKCGKNELKLTFSEIEKILGFKLSYSAYTYPAQWTKSQSFAYGWLNAGYLVRQVNIREQTVVFYKETVINQNNERLKIEKMTVSSLPVEDAIRCIKTYFYETIEDKHGRYLSWQHCYNAFKENRNICDEKTLDYLSLHLAFYLASWGMYRGSSFLLQKDYRVHIPIVKIIMEEKYNSLMGIEAEGLLDDDNLDLLDDISNRIRKAYADEQPSFEGIINKATDTLVTKILLGTLGCVPAYDRYYVQTVKQYGISSGNYNRQSVKAVAEYYLENKVAFEKEREKLSSGGTEYPMMKLMDMCMWQLAFEEDNSDIVSDNNNYITNDSLNKKS